MKTRIGQLVILLMALAAASAAEHHVKLDGTSDFASVQEAIDAAEEGYIVIVHPGTYCENIRFNGQNIVLRSTIRLNSSICFTLVLVAIGWTSTNAKHRLRSRLAKHNVGIAEWLAGPYERYGGDAAASASHYGCETISRRELAFSAR